MTSRAELRRRRRRIIWNNDGDDLRVPANWKDDDTSYAHFRRRFTCVDDYLRQRMKGKLEGTQVDSIFTCGYTSVPNWEFPTENTAAIGPDPLVHAVEFAHTNGMEFLYSFRMNDIHLSAHRARWLWSGFRMENLHLLQGRPDPRWPESAAQRKVRGSKIRFW